MVVSFTESSMHVGEIPENAIVAYEVPDDVTFSRYFFKKKAKRRQARGIDVHWTEVAREFFDQVGRRLEVVRRNAS